MKNLNNIIKLDALKKPNSFAYSLLKRAIRKVKRNKLTVSDGMMMNLFQLESSRGWIYQADLVRDSRFNKKSFVSVFAFAPKTWGQYSYGLKQELNNK